MTKIEMEKGFRKRLREYQKKKQREVDDFISVWLSKLIIKATGLIAVGFLLGRLAK